MAADSNSQLRHHEFYFVAYPFVQSAELKSAEREFADNRRKCSQITDVLKTKRVRNIIIIIYIYAASFILNYGKLRADITTLVVSVRLICFSWIIYSNYNINCFALPQAELNEVREKLRPLIAEEIALNQRREEIRNRLSELGFNFKNVRNRANPDPRFSSEADIDQEVPLIMLNNLKIDAIYRARLPSSSINAIANSNSWLCFCAGEKNRFTGKGRHRHGENFNTRTSPRGESDERTGGIKRNSSEPGRREAE